MDKLLDKYLNKNEKEEFLNIIEPIVNHYEFQRRMTKKFPHHSDITLGMHILEVAILTYKKCKKLQLKNKKVDIKTAVYIAMMHDLYTVCWQNNNDANVKHFFNKHGFRHPLEATINSITWFNDLFNEQNSEILIDGILHHMYPLPIRKVTNNIDLELKNNKEYENLDIKYKEIIIKCTKRRSVFNISICKSKYIEGRIVSNCDKKVSFSQIKNIDSLTSLITGKNKSIM